MFGEDWKDFLAPLAGLFAGFLFAIAFVLAVLSTAGR